MERVFTNCATTIWSMIVSAKFKLKVIRGPHLCVFINFENV